MIGVLVAAIALPGAVEAQSCPPALTPDEVVGPLADVREGRAVGHGPTRAGQQLTFRAVLGDRR